MKKTFVTIFMVLIVSAKTFAGDTIEIKNAFFFDPVSYFDILINKKNVDKNLILTEIDSDENPIESIQVDYSITSSSVVINKTNVTLILDNNDNFQIKVENFILKNEIEPITVEITIKKDGASKTVKEECNLYYIHNVVQIDSFTFKSKTVKYNRRDTIWGVNDSKIHLTYSVKLNNGTLGIPIKDIEENPFYKNIIGNSFPSGKNDTVINYFKNIDTIFHQNIELEPGFNKVVYTMFDKPIDWTFSDSIMIFYVKIDETQQKEFCKTDTIIHLKALPEGGGFRFAENSLGLQSGILGNTNVFNPSRTSDALKSVKVEYNYRFVLDKKEFFFSDTMQIIVNSLPPDFSIEGKSENCAFENGVEYKVVSNDKDFDATKYLVNWKINGEIISGNGYSQIVDWGNKTKSEIGVEITEKNTGCSVSRLKFVKVGSNEIPLTVPELAYREDQEKNNILLFSNTVGNVNQYIWYLPGGNDTISTTNYILLPAVYGNYTLRTAYDGNPGCYSNSSNLTIEQSVASKSNQIMIFPNPFTNNICIDTQNELKQTIQFSFTLKNQIGDIVVKGDFTGRRYEIDCSNVPKGLYLLEITDGSETISRKIVK
jgi:hypothetical protein